MRCDNITVGYTWPSLLKETLRLRLYGAVQKPFVITGYKGIDPEIYGGIDRSVYPRPVSFTVGVDSDFLILVTIASECGWNFSSKS